MPYDIVEHSHKDRNASSTTNYVAFAVALQGALSIATTARRIRVMA